MRHPCPNCHAAFLVVGGKKAAPELQCVSEGCGYKLAVTPEEASVPLAAPDGIFEETPTLTPAMLSKAMAELDEKAGKKPAKSAKSAADKPAGKAAAGKAAAPKAAARKAPAKLTPKEAKQKAELKAEATRVIRRPKADKASTTAS